MELSIGFIGIYLSNLFFRRRKKTLLVYDIDSKFNMAAVVHNSIVVVEVIVQRSRAKPCNFGDQVIFLFSLVKKVKNRSWETLVIA